MSKKCPYCGAVLEDDDKFCGECGKKQESAAGGGSAGEDVKVSPVEGEKKKKRIIQIAIAVFVVIVLLSMCGGCSASQPEETASLTDTEEVEESF